MTFKQSRTLTLGKLVTQMLSVRHDCCVLNNIQIYEERHFMFEINE